MTKKIVIAAAAAMAMAISAAPASAETFLFKLSGSRNATFSFDPVATSPSFRNSTFIGDQLAFDAVPGTFGGVVGTARISFGNNLVADLNIQNANLGFTQFSSPDFFRLVGTQPVFTPGTYNLTSIGSGASTLSISQLAGAVPEPATWAMMILGFGVVGGALRRRRKMTGFTAPLATA